MYGFPTSSTQRLPTIVSPSKKATTSTNGQPLQLVTISGNSDISAGNASGNANLYAEIDLSAGGLWASALAGQFFTNSFILGNPALPDVADLRMRNTYNACDITGSVDCTNWGNGRTTFGQSILARVGRCKRRCFAARRWRRAFGSRGPP